MFYNNIGNIQQQKILHLLKKWNEHPFNGMQVPLGLSGLIWMCAFGFD